MEIEKAIKINKAKRCASVETAFYYYYYFVSTITKLQIINTHQIYY
jgi:hypothetical protein